MTPREQAKWRLINKQRKAERQAIADAMYAYSPEDQARLDEWKRVGELPVYAGADRAIREADELQFGTEAF